jgi:hypothetical protein
MNSGDAAYDALQAVLREAKSALARATSPEEVQSAVTQLKLAQDNCNSYRSTHLSVARTSYKNRIVASLR